MEQEKNVATQEEVMEFTRAFQAVQELPEIKRTAVKYYLRGMLDNSLLEATAPAQS